MLDEAFAQVAAAVGSAVGGPYYDGKILLDGSPVYDSGGSIVTPGSATQADCSVQVDSVTEAMRLDADFLERDVRLLILCSSALTTAPRVRVEAGPFAGSVYELRSVSRDPLGLGWECRGRAA